MYALVHKPASQTHAHAAPAQDKPTPFFQPKLTVNTPGDAHEQQADPEYSGPTVMRMPAFVSSAGKRQGDTPIVQRVSFTTLPPSENAAQRSEMEEDEQVQRKEKPAPHFFGNEPIVVQRKCAECEQENIQRKKLTGSQAVVIDSSPAGESSNGTNSIQKQPSNPPSPSTAPACPSSTEVATAIDLRDEALAAGFHTAYGIHSQMRVRPDERTWDGTQISESLTIGSNSCPDTLTRGEPCSGTSTFVVGAQSGNSPVLSAPRPGVRNCFWDFHTTHVRPKDVSVLHSATRNPANLDACSNVCNQEYRCGGNIIGRHTITRNFSKGKHNGHDVTFVDVTKTDSQKQKSKSHLWLGILGALGLVGGIIGGIFAGQAIAGEKDKTAGGAIGGVVGGIVGGGLGAGAGALIDEAAS